jgi:hypothetical protein
LRAKVLKLEQVAHELPSAVRNDHAIRLCEALQARREVRCLANDCLLLRSARPDQVADHYQSRRNADPRLEGRVGLQSTYCCDQFQPCAHGSLSIVLVGLGIAEVNQDAIAHVLRYKPAKNF